MWSSPGAIYSILGVDTMLLALSLLIREGGYYFDINIKIEIKIKIRAKALTKIDGKFNTLISDIQNQDASRYVIYWSF
jgi:hypothetical protein